MIQRKKVNSGKVNWTISFIFHGVLALIVLFVAAREGILGKKLKEITVIKVNDKKPEQAKEKPQEPKPEPPKDEPKVAVAAPKIDVPAPPADAGGAAAPAAVSLPSFDFSDGAHAVATISDANGLYKAGVEYLLRSHWNRPEDLDDAKYVAEVQLTVNPKGDVENYQWVSGSGNQRWDDSVKAVMDETQSIGKAPPKGFPGTFVVRFDVQTSEVDDPLQLSMSR